MPSIEIPLPELRFPEDGWRDRFDRYTATAERTGLELEARLEPGASATALAAAPGVQGALRAFLAGANGGRIGHLHLLPASAIATSDFASDYVGTYQLRPGEPHEVVLASREPGEEDRFTSLGTFLESALVRAYAAALHRKAEVDAGDDLDDAPWIAAARALELRIDPKIQSTRED
jgi:hypothetical protein